MSFKRKRALIIGTLTLVFTVLLFGMGKLVYQEGYTNGYTQGTAKQWEEDKVLVKKGIQALDEAIDTLEQTKVTIGED